MEYICTKVEIPLTITNIETVKVSNKNPQFTTKRSEFIQVPNVKKKKFPLSATSTNKYREEKRVIHIIATEKILTPSLPRYLPKKPTVKKLIRGVNITKSVKLIWNLNFKIKV